MVALVNEKLLEEEMRDPAHAFGKGHAVSRVTIKQKMRRIGIRFRARRGG